MSSKILSGKSARAARPMVWKRIDAGCAGGAPPGEAPAGWAGEDSAGGSAMEARLAQLEVEMRRREEEARRQGFAEGEAAQREKLAAPMHEAARRLADQARELAELRTRVRREAEQDVVKLAVAIARRILRRELNVDPAVLLGLVKAALERVEAREVLRLRVHTDDARMVEKALKGAEMPARFEVIGDPGLEPGAVILETLRGDLDASLETQLSEIDRGLMDLVRRRSV